MARIDEYLKLAIQRGASDVHLSSDMPGALRLDGDLVLIDEPAHTSDALEAMLYEILSEEEREKLVANKNLDKSYRLANIGSFRANIFFAYHGIGAVFRSIPVKVPTMQELGLPAAVAKVIESNKGLILVTGPTGSGKSTTLASIIDLLNRTKKYHILTVEDPIEFVHKSQMSLVTQREIGSHCQSFADALKYALREDPDVILVGEMRDLETISLAITAAETGHLVFGTLHTRGAAASVDRIIDSFPSNQQAMIRTMLSESLIAVLSQVLLKRVDGRGRVAAFELLILNNAVSNLIREGKTFQIVSTMQTSRKEGMQLMDQHILHLVDQGLVWADEAEAYLSDPSLVMNKGKRSTQAGAQATSRPRGPVAGPIAPPAFNQPANGAPAAVRKGFPPQLPGRPPAGSPPATPPRPAAPPPRPAAPPLAPSAGAPKAAPARPPGPPGAPPAATALWNAGGPPSAPPAQPAAPKAASPLPDVPTFSPASGEEEEDGTEFAGEFEVSSLPEVTEISDIHSLDRENTMSSPLPPVEESFPSSPPAPAPRPAGVAKLPQGFPTPGDPAYEESEKTIGGDTKIGLPPPPASLFRKKRSG